MREGDSVSPVRVVLRVALPKSTGVAGGSTLNIGGHVTKLRSRVFLLGSLLYML